MAQEKKIIFLINPISGVRSKKNIPELIENHLDTTKFSYEIAYTKSSEHAVELTKNAIQKQPNEIVAVGGDGTINLIAGELVQTEIPLAILPLGSGNGLARALRIPLDLKKAIELINQEHTGYIDTGIANSVRFMNVCGFGFDAHVSSKFAEAGTRGFKTYAKVSLQELSTYQLKKYQLSFSEKQVTETAFILAICNGPQYGNNAYIAPLAEFNDGLFDITVLKKVSWKNAIGLSKDLFMRTLHQSKLVNNYRTDEIIIEQEDAAYVNIDGEPIWFEPKVHIKLLRNSLKLILPKP
jgi:diacylglycerol kinase (ATP)